MQTMEEIEAVRRLAAQAAAAERTERERRRVEALKKLAALDKEEAAKFAEIDKRLAAAKREAAAARLAWQRAEAAAGKVRSERAAAGAVATVRRNRLLADVRAAVPELVETFLADAQRELRALAKVEPALREVPGGDVLRGFFRVGQQREWQGTGPVIMSRAEKLSEAIRTARHLVDEDLGDEDLAARLDSLRESIPEVGFVKLAGRPLDARPLDTV